MKLYFLRHGHADWPQWTAPDSERPLTPAGRETLERSAQFWRQRALSPQIILSSPLPRAAQTAQIVGAVLPAPVRLEASLAPGCDWPTLCAVLREALAKTPAREVLLVGHEPDCSEIIATLTGARLRMAKGGLARVDVAEEVGALTGRTRGRLIWLVPPRLSAAEL